MNETIDTNDLRWQAVILAFRDNPQAERLRAAAAELEDDIELPEDFMEWVEVDE